MAAIQTLMLIDAYRTYNGGDFSRDVTVMIDGDNVRLILHYGQQITISRDDLARINELLAAYDAAQPGTVDEVTG